jgi:hypothetical protein
LEGTNSFNAMEAMRFSSVEGCGTHVLLPQTAAKYR